MKGESIGIIGKTGSGKSTLCDLLMGLLAPSYGRITVDGQDLHDSDNPHRLASWRSTIAMSCRRSFCQTQPLLKTLLSVS